MNSAPSHSSLKGHRQVLFILVLMSFFCAIAAIVVVHFFFVLPSAETLRRGQIEALLQERASNLNGLSRERVRFGYDLAATGEDFYRLARSGKNSLSPEEWEEQFQISLSKYFSSFPEVVGGGIWYEPFVFDAKEKYRGYYIQWVPPVGAGRKLEFTMDWSDPSADYHLQDWYTTLLPQDLPRTKRLMHDVAWTAPYKDPVTGVVMITVDVAMYGESGEIIGMSTVDWNLDQISLIIEETQPTRSSQAFLLDPISKKFVAVTQQPELKLGDTLGVPWGHAVPLNPPIKSFWTGVVEVNHSPSLLYARTLESGLIFGFLIPEAEVVGDIQRSHQVAMVVLLIVVTIPFILLVLWGQRMIFERLTQLQLARDEAVRTSELKSEFLANMSHEIRTPMNGVLGMIDIMLDHQHDQEVSKLLHLCHHSAKNLLRVINDILDSSRLEAGRLRLVYEPFSIAQLITNTLEVYEHSVDSPHLLIVPFIDPKLPKLSIGDEGRIGQILINLIGNAIKFSHSHGAVIVAAELREALEGSDRIAISVADTGIGIPEDKHSVIFEKFMQVDGGSARVVGGTGLGLSISKKLAEQLGGELTLQSRVGVGSRFILEIPLARADDSTIPAEPKGARKALPHKTARILVAEDNAINQQLVLRILEHAGYIPTIVSDGIEAIEALHKHSFDLVLMDLQMPRMDGLRTLKEIRALNLKKVPIIALTAHAMDDHRERALAAGFDGYFTKPIDRKLFLKEIERHLRS